jgi:catechol 2,3-dioxygenase-like lactoylglutathione lyase family enzyme
MSRVQLALRVADLDASIAFYSKLFAAEPAKRRPGYANFAITEPPLKLVLIEGGAGEPTRLDHLGVEVETAGEVAAATARLAAEGLVTATEEDAACCYAVQDKVWVAGPGSEPWEIYVVKGDSDILDKDVASVCCARIARPLALSRQPAVNAPLAGPQGRNVSAKYTVRPAGVRKTPQSSARRATSARPGPASLSPGASASRGDRAES